MFWSIGVNVGYENRIRPYNKNNQVSLGWGVHTGVQIYPGLSITHNATGSNSEVEFGNYRTYGYVPLMVSASMYITTRPTASFFLQLAAGGNMLLGQRDFAAG